MSGIDVTSSRMTSPRPRRWAGITGPHFSSRESTFILIVIQYSSIQDLEAYRRNAASASLRFKAFATKSAPPHRRRNWSSLAFCASIAAERAAAAAAAMEANARFGSSRALIFLLLFSCCVSSGLCIVDDKCGACKAVALELEESLANERPRNHLDYRHRLGSSGQREGKVIDYRVSELRVVELLDGLCAKMKGYIPNKVESGREMWLKVEGGVPDVPEMYLNKRASELHSRAIVEFCGRLIETTEEELTEKIRVGEVATGDVERVLCKELSKSCNETSETPSLAENLDKEDLDDEGHDVDAPNSVEDNDEEKSETSAKDAEANAQEAVSMGSDGEL